MICDDMEEDNEVRTWADIVAEQMVKKKKKAKYICHGMWTPSGFFHLGNSRPEIFTPYSVAHALENLGHKIEQHFILDDFDAVDKVPEGLNVKEEDKEQFIGYSCATAPSPIPGFKTWAEAFVYDVKSVIEDYGVKPIFYSAYETYKEGKFDKIIVEALNKSVQIVTTWNKIAGSDKQKNFLPVKVVCEQCKKIHFTDAISWDGKLVGYKCTACGHEAQVKPEKGKVKLHWRVHWPAHWQLYDVDFESAGKDHFSKGGSVDVSQAIAREIFGIEPPFQTPTEFIQLGKEKMSGSRGNLFTMKDWVSVANPESFRYLNFSRKPNGVIELNLRDNSFLIAMEEFERAERIFYAKEHAQSEKLDKRIARSYELSLIGKPTKEIPQRISYSFSILLSQLFDAEKNISDVEELMLNAAHIERKLNNDEKNAVQLQLKRTKNWIDKFAPDQYKIKFLEDASAANVSANVKELFKEIAPMIDKAKSADELQTKIYELTKSKNIAPKEMFQALYGILIGKQFGPKIGTLIFALGKERVKQRLTE